MARWQGLSHRRKTGARIKKHHEKRKSELGKPEAQTIIGEPKIKEIHALGDNLKLRALSLEHCNLSDPATNKTEKVRILDVETNPANKEFTRRKIITKGALIKTEKGYAIVTNRPGQEGIVTAIPTQLDVEKTQEQTISKKKKKRQTILKQKYGASSGAPQRKESVKTEPPKAEPKVKEEVKIEPKKEAISASKKAEKISETQPKKEK